MHAGAITDYIDVAQVSLYLFWLFFAGLIYALRREDRREGWPLVSDMPGRVPVHADGAPSPKTFLLTGGGKVLAPRREVVPPSNSVPAVNFPGAPFVPVGDPMLAAVGPGSYVLRADVPELMFETGDAKIVPLRAAHEFGVADQDKSPVGYTVVGADDVAAGTVVDLWVDKAEAIFRYLELSVESPTGPRQVLVPMTFITVSDSKKQVKVRAILGKHFANAPMLAHADQITKREEDQVCGYYGGGTLYATPERAEPML